MKSISKSKRKEKKITGALENMMTPRGKEMDIPLFIITMVILIFGLVMLYSASYVRGLYQWGDSYYYIKDQLFLAVAGVVIMLFASKVDYHFYRNWGPFLFVLVCILLLIVQLFMPEVNDAKRWIIIKNVVTFQPSEIAKFTMILLFANMIEKNYDKMNTVRYGVRPFGFIVAVFSAFLLLEPHVSCTVIICAVAAIMMLTGGTNKKWFFFLFVVGICAIVIAFMLFRDEVSSRVMPRLEAWWYPERDRTDKGYQSYQSLLAIGSGGLFGLGLGNSRQKHLHLPEPQNDFIFSVICEELGFVGGMMVLILFILLFLRGIYIAMRAKDKYGAMLVIGIICQITLQALLNMAVATNTIPNTGISLPFFSEGGTSLVMLLGEMGIVLSVSRYAHLENGEK